MEILPYYRSNSTGNTSLPVEFDRYYHSFDRDTEYAPRLWTGAFMHDTLIVLAHVCVTFRNTRHIENFQCVRDA